jgi:hypothetical protein
MKTLQAEIFALLESKLKGKFIYSVMPRNHYFGGEYLEIWIACSMIDINNVAGQKPQVVSLCLEFPSLELRPQVFGGNGGQCIYRQPNLEEPKEKYLAMKSVKVPFRKPTATKEKVMECIGKFADNYIKTLRENIKVLKYQDIVNYEAIL